MSFPNGWSLTGSGGGLMQGNIFPLQVENICIGTDTNACAIIYPSEATGISAIHCQLTFKNGSWLLTDFSDTGTWLNGVRLEKGQIVPVKPHDEIMIANSSNIFTINFKNEYPPLKTPHSTDNTIKEKYFNFKGRLNRKRYILRIFMVALIYFLASFLIGILVGLTVNRSNQEEVVTIAVFILYIPFLISCVMLAIRRLHDTDHSGWWWFTGLIPIVNFYTIYLILFQKGTDGQNRYGDDPLPRKRRESPLL